MHNLMYPIGCPMSSDLGKYYILELVNPGIHQIESH